LEVGDLVKALQPAQRSPSPTQPTPDTRIPGGFGASGHFELNQVGGGLCSAVAREEQELYEDSQSAASSVQCHPFPLSTFQ
jgi:hypothetical protein